MQPEAAQRRTERTRARLTVRDSLSRVAGMGMLRHWQGVVMIRLQGSMQGFVHIPQWQ